MSGSVTISLLPVSLSIVHIPRSRLHSLLHPVLRHILLPSPTFLNITCNEIELSLFAEHHALEDFEFVARKDARKLRMRGRSSASQARHDRTMHRKHWEPIEVSHEKWNVLQIDSHSDALDKSGARVHELSAPLAAAGISILYQSSYMSDFIFVKEHRLSEVMSLLASAGFDLYSSDPEQLISQVSAFTSPLLSPLGEDASSIHLLDLASSGPSFSTENGAVLTRSMSSTESTSRSGLSEGLLHLRMSGPRGSRAPLADKEGDSPSAAEANGDIEKPLLIRTQNHSPSGCDVRVLQPDLTCIGLADDNAEMWGLKVVKLIAFPELIPGTHVPPLADALRSGDGPYSAYASPKQTCLPVKTHDSDGDVSDTPSLSETESNATTRVDSDLPKNLNSRSSSSSPFTDFDRRQKWEEDNDGEEENEDEEESSDDEAYYSPDLDEDGDVSSPASPVHHPDDKSDRFDDSKPTGNGARKQRPSLTSLDTASPPMRDYAHRPRPRSANVPQAVQDNAPPPIVPFFSFTRTREGSSLTSTVSLLAALFPPSERHMVICSGELDVLDSRAISPEGAAIRAQRDIGESVPDESIDGAEEDLELQGTLKCLQIDLRRFGLDKHGLVRRFSHTLEENGINHMYSATYRTANLLVDKAHARRAQAVLRSC